MTKFANDRGQGMGILNRDAVNENHFKSTSTTQEFPLGLEVDVRDAAYTNSVKTFLYIKAHGALSQYATYQVDHNGGRSGLVTKALTTGAARYAIAQEEPGAGSWAANAFGFIQIKGDATCRIGAQTTYVIGDHIESRNGLTYALVDGDSGSTAQTINTFGVVVGDESNGSTAKDVAIYMFGDKADIAANT